MHRDAVAPLRAASPCIFIGPEAAAEYVALVESFAPPGSAEVDLLKTLGPLGVIPRSPGPIARAIMDAQRMCGRAPWPRAR